MAYGTGTEWFIGVKGNDNPPNAAVIETFKTAFRVGYRHLNCAEVYGTEREIGIALQQFLTENPQLTRNHFFISTKVWPHINDLPSAIKGSLSRLGLTYVDLYMIHSPFLYKVNCKASLSQVWSQMETLVDQGLTKFIGVSNYRIKDFEEFLPHARIKPICNEIEYNPYLQQSDLIDYCKHRGIIVTAFAALTPLHNKTGGPVNSIVEKIAAKYQKSLAQILLKWVLQKGIIVITTSKQEARLREYLELEQNERSFQLTNEEMKEIDEVGNTVKYRKYWENDFKSSKL
jgi:diketogulonate reductase-like aldo/keto reductase